MAVMGDAHDAGLDVGELYASLAGRLERIVSLDVRAPQVVIEDACQFAWIQLLHHRHRVRGETVMSWLATTAVREAFKLLRREGRELSLESALEPEDESGQARSEPASVRSARTPQDLLEQRSRLSEVGRLPRRQQRVLWLHALGLSYAEIALREGCTLRTVERQLLRAKAGLRELARA